MTALAGTGAGTTTHRHPPIAAVKTPHHHHSPILPFNQSQNPRPWPPCSTSVECSLRVLLSSCANSSHTTTSIPFRLSNKSLPTSFFFQWLVLATKPTTTTTTNKQNHNRSAKVIKTPQPQHPSPHAHLHQPFNFPGQILFKITHCLQLHCRFLFQQLNVAQHFFF